MMGYCSAANLEVWEQQGLEAYISTSWQQHGLTTRPSRGRAPRDLDARGRIDRKLRSAGGQAIYAMRKTIVEPVFGQIKGARCLDRLRMRGLEKVNGESALIATSHNILKLLRATVAMARGPPQGTLGLAWRPAGQPLGPVAVAWSRLNVRNALRVR